MIIEFTVQNYLSFRDRNALSLVALHEHASTQGETEDPVIHVNDKLALLTVTGMFGANASGKTNVIRGISDFRNTVLRSSDSDFRLIEPEFLYSSSASERETTLELQFVMDGLPYRYGFSFLNGLFTAEWLYVSKSSWETKLFERKGDHIDRGRTFREGSAFIDDGLLTNPSALFLTLASRGRGGDVCKDILAFIKQKVEVITGLTDTQLRKHTIDCLETNRHTAGIKALLSHADFGLTDVRLMDEGQISVELSPQPAVSDADLKRLEQEIINEVRLVSRRTVYNEENLPTGTREAPFALHESQGTQKLFALAGPLMDALHSGAALFVDELDAKLHPMLTKAIIELFQSPISNPNGAQLVFATHDTNLLHSAHLRRDQIWFVDKDQQGASKLYALSDFRKSQRKSANIEKDYLDGCFGALPFIEEFSSVQVSPATGNNVSK